MAAAPAAANNNELQQQITEYSNFITKTLQPQLQSAVDAREETESEIAEYRLLQSKLQQQIRINTDAMKGSSINTIVDLAHQTIYCKANIPNPRIIYINIGFFHVEMTIPEAITFINKRVQYLEQCVLKHRVENAVMIAKDVEKSLELLDELGLENDHEGEMMLG